MKKGKARLEINSNTIAGFLSIILLAIELMGLGVLILSGSGFGGLLDFIFIFTCSYIIYKTLFKKEKLTKWEWVAAIIVFILGFVSILVGFIIGVIVGYLGTV